MVAASIARSLAGERAAFGIAAAGYTGAETRFAHIPVSAAPGPGGARPRPPRPPLVACFRAVRAAARRSSTGSPARARRSSCSRRGIRRRSPATSDGSSEPGCRVLIVACGRQATADAARARCASGSRRAAPGSTAPWRTAESWWWPDDRPAPSTTLPRRRVAPSARRLPLGLVIVAEAAWISVVAGLVQEFALREPTLGIMPLAAFVAAGVVAARRVGGPPRRPMAARRPPA